MVLTGSWLLIEFLGPVNVPLWSSRNSHPNLCHRLTLRLSTPFVYPGPPNSSHPKSKVLITGGLEVKVWMLQYKPISNTRQATHIMFFLSSKRWGFFSSFSDSLVSFPSCSLLLQLIILLISAFLNKVWGPFDLDSLLRGSRNMHFKQAPQMILVYMKISEPLICYLLGQIFQPKEQ